jgi:tetratricopeptide (TPR) repeat protein
MNESGRAREFNDKALDIFRKLRADRSLSIAYLNLGLRSNNTDSAMIAFDSAYYLAKRKGNMEDIMADALSNKVNLLKLKDRWDEYLMVVKELDSLGAKLSTPEIAGWNQIKYGEYYRHRNMHDSSIQHFKKAARLAEEMGYTPMAYWADRYLYETYRSIDVRDSALVYLEKMTLASAKAQNMDPLSKFWDLDFQKNVELKAELEEARVFRARTIKVGVGMAILVPLLLIIVYFRRRG